MRGYFLTIWNILDPIYYRFTRLSYLLDCHSSDNIFRVRLTRYKGKEVTLSDGTVIKKNDRLVKIHLHNVRLLTDLRHINTDIVKARIIYQSVKRSLPGIERYISNHKDSQDIKGIIGITSLNRACSRLGFDVKDISHPFYKWLKWATFLPIIILSSADFLNNKKNVLKASPSYLFMSKEKLSKMYRN
ncbi:hypothetical protein JOC77_000578 [Peribacillus deserti]|uniref:YkoP-like domain-containing protein n=1 Tax=Peribacillus deserti TaxID=673318 RepID=A0ABS2QDE7_9BACI|nr:hypothetical protein [Peribacillus deserti]MBM7691173.1 hypothetical protein [Peribacillus deserti]